MLSPCRIEKLKHVQWLQLFATLSGSLIKLTTGIMLAWSSPSTPKLVGYTENQIFIVTCIYNVSQLVSIPLVALTVDRIGRKNGILWCTLPITFSWIAMALSQGYGKYSYEIVCFARFIGGLGCGYGKTVISIYATEISQAKSRGIMGTMTSFMTRFGMLLIFTIGPFVSIPTMSIIASVFPILMFVTFIWMPKSPYFLLLQGKPEAAKQSLALFRGKHWDITEEFLHIQKSVAKRLPLPEVMNKLIHNPVNRRALLILIIINGIEQFSGMTVILSYSQYIFELSGSTISPAICSIITISVQTIAMGVIMPFMDLFGRKTLMIVSSIGTGVAMAVISGYFYVNTVLSWDLSQFTLVPLLALICYHIMSMVGISSVPTILQNELFATEVKASAISVGAIFMQIMTVFVTKIFSIFKDTNLIYVTFAFYSFCCFFSIVLTILFIPETKGLTLEDIQVLLKSKVKKIEKVPKKPISTIFV